MPSYRHARTCSGHLPRGHRGGGNGCPEQIRRFFRMFPIDHCNKGIKLSFFRLSRRDLQDQSSNRMQNFSIPGRQSAACGNPIPFSSVSVRVSGDGTRVVATGMVQFRGKLRPSDRSARLGTARIPRASNGYFRAARRYPFRLAVESSRLPSVLRVEATVFYQLPHDQPSEPSRLHGQTERLRWAGDSSNKPERLGSPVGTLTLTQFSKTRF